MKLSQKDQALLNSLEFDEMDMTHEEELNIYNLVMEKGGFEVEESDNLKSPEKVTALPKKKFKFGYFVAAIVATAALTGAGFLASQYFDNIYTRADIPDTYDMAKENPEIRLETPIFQPDNDTVENSIPIIELDLMGRLNLGPVFEGRNQGDLFDVEIRTDYMKAVAQGLSGKGLGLLSMVDDEGFPSTEIVVNKKNAPTTQSLVDKMISNGQFLVTIDNPEYTPSDYSASSYGSSLHYTGKEGTAINIMLKANHGGVREMPESIYDNASPEDITINGNKFVLMKVNDAYLADLYLEGGENLGIDKVTIGFGSVATDREKVMEILNSIVVHNKGNNTISVVDNSFFQKFPQPEIKENAAEITNLVFTKSSNDSSAPTGVPVWEKDGYAVKSYDKGQRVLVEFKEGFNTSSSFYPFANQHTALTEQSWFPKDSFTTLSISYEGAEMKSAQHLSEDGKYTLVSEISKNGYALTPLDAIIAQAGGREYVVVDKLIDSLSDNPIVMISQPDSNQTAIFSASKNSNGEFLVQQLLLAKSDLPAELR